MGIKNGKDVHLLKNLIVFAIIISLTLAQAASAGIVETGITPGVTTPCDGRLITFEDGRSEIYYIDKNIEGLLFSTLYNWLYGGPTKRGPFFVFNGSRYAWLGATQSSGRINFTYGATYFSLLTSTSADISLEAFNGNGNRLDSATTVSNYGSLKLTKMTVNASGIAYVYVNGTADRFLIDDICTDAPATAPTSIPEFPTLLVPIISAIGLMLLFQKRKYR